MGLLRVTSFLGLLFKLCSTELSRGIWAQLGVFGPIKKMYVHSVVFHSLLASLCGFSFALGGIERLQLGFVGRGWGLVAFIWARLGEGSAIRLSWAY